MPNASSIIQTTIQQIGNMVLSMGKSAVSALAPDNFESYQCSLELLNIMGVREGYISFVVMPNNISESASPIQTQSKTKNGIVTLFNSSFVPVNIQLQGNFGRKIRVGVNSAISPYETENNFLQGNIATILGASVTAKTGYGMTKVLHYILKRANEVDENGDPYILLYRNFAFNSYYVVDVMNYSFSQNTQNNMIWDYSLSLKAVAPGDSINKAGMSVAQAVGAIAGTVIASGLTSILNSVKRNNTFNYV